MSERLTIVSWCPGGACDPCGIGLARLHPISASVDFQSITEIWGSSGSATDLTGKTIIGGLIQCDYLITPDITPPYDFMFGDGSWWTGQYGMQPPEAHYGSRPNPDGYNVSISTPGPSGGAHNTNIVYTPDYASGQDIGSLSNFSLTASTTGFFGVVPGSYDWSIGFGDVMFIGGFEAWIKFRD